jgi:hypothetical protein
MNVYEGKEEYERKGCSLRIKIDNKSPNKERTD